MNLNELKNQKEMIPILKTSEGLRDALFDEINLLRSGKGNPQRARTICLIASRIIDSIRVQIQYGRLLNEKDKISKDAYLGATKTQMRSMQKGN